MTDLEKIALKLGTDGPVKTLPTSRLVQLLFNGVYIIRTTKAVLVWEHPYYPQLYIPHADLIDGKDSKYKLNEGEHYASESGARIGTHFTLTVGSRQISSIIAFSHGLPSPAAALNELVRIDFASVDQWFEEDTPIFVHPKDPFKRVDVLQSTRPIQVSIGGKVVAKTTTAAHLYETGLPTRYYLPFSSILDPRILKPSTRRTKCPYKGEAEYYSVEVDGKLYEDIIWYYTTPLLECAKIEGLLCFYNEKVEIELDGEKLESPVTHFSKNKGPPSII